MHYCRPSQFVAVESVSSFCSTCDEPVGRSIPKVQLEVGISMYVAGGLSGVAEETFRLLSNTS